ncbi:MAG: hypothetical protein ACKVI6_01090 [Candidatus Poseidoniales archaeon]|jgi:hypothetical protein
MKEKIFSVILNFIFIMPIIIISLNLITFNSSAANSCVAPGNNEWDISESIQTHDIQYGLMDSPLDFNANEEEISPLTRGFSHELLIENDSSTAISMELAAGYKYNFCISFSPSMEEKTTISTGDVYLMTESNWEIYRSEYSSRSFDWIDSELLENIPVEWRDMATWLPFRDVHSYENIEYEEFSVGIDTSGPTWSSIIGGGNNQIIYYLVLDGWDNSRISDSPAAGNKINVEIIVEVEERMAIPIFTAYLAIGALPLSCIIIPILFHVAYKNGANDKKIESFKQVPLLEE